MSEPDEVARELASGRSIHLFDDGRELTVGPHGGWWHVESQTKFREVPAKS